MAASREESEYLTALAADYEQVTVASSSTVFETALEEQIERSKCHWSELAEPDSNSIDDDGEAKADNQKAFKELQMHPTWGNFFRTFGYDLGIRGSSGELVVGKKFAEGGQASLYDVHVKWRNPRLNERDLEKGVEFVLKIFKKGTFVRDLKECSSAMQTEGNLIILGSHEGGGGTDVMYVVQLCWRMADLHS